MRVPLSLQWTWLIQRQVSCKMSSHWNIWWCCQFTCKSVSSRSFSCLKHPSKPLFLTPLGFTDVYNRMTTGLSELKVSFLLQLPCWSMCHKCFICWSFCMLGDTFAGPICLHYNLNGSRNSRCWATLHWWPLCHPILSVSE